LVFEDVSLSSPSPEHTAAITNKNNPAAINYGTRYHIQFQDWRARCRLKVAHKLVARIEKEMLVFVHRREYEHVILMLFMGIN
jgi:hypothetical protein